VQHGQRARLKLLQVSAVGCVRIQTVAKEKSTLTAFFRAMDKDGSGSLDAEEFTTALLALGLQLTRAERRLCISVLDKDGDGNVDVEEFVDRMNAVRRAQLGRDGSWQPSATPEDPIEVHDGIKLCNNQLADVALLPRFIAPYLLMQRPSTLQWLDLSFNRLSSIEPSMTEALPNLSILYLHANQISELSAVASVGTLSRLEKLTLHGNPVELKPSYRPRVLLIGSLLRELDFVPVSKKDREAARQLHASRGRKKAATAQAGEGSSRVASNPFGRMGRTNKTLLGSRLR
jgi:hypothetical protein